MDLFAAAVVIFVLVCGHAPFQMAVNRDFRYRYIISGDLEMFWNLQPSANAPPSTAFKELIEKALAPNPRDRPTISELRASTWMAQETPDKTAVA
jgi:serine/threonine protein kinase